jgi:hypothetical protein
MLLLAATSHAANETVTTGRNYDPYRTIFAEDCEAVNAPYKTVCYDTDDFSSFVCPVVSDGCLSDGTGWEPASSAGGGGLVDNDYGDFTCVSEVCSLDITPAVPRAYYGMWSAATTADDIFVKVAGGAITLTNLSCVATGGTTPSAFVITVDECDGNATNCAASGGTVTLSALITNTADATFTDAAVDDDDYIRLDITSLTTSPDFAFCRLEFTQP